MTSPKAFSSLSFLLLSVAGCAGTCSDVVKPVAIEVPVVAPCSGPEILQPQWPSEEFSEKTGVYKGMQGLLGEIELRQAYETKLKAALEACR